MSTKQQKRLLLGLAGAVFLAVSGASSMAQAPACKEAPCKFEDPNLPTSVRVDDLIAHMTLEEKAAQMQDAAAAIPRLGIPEYNWWNEALHGVARRGVATVFPQAIGLAATWDTDLLQSVGDTVSTEARAKFNESPQGNKARYYGLTFWSPNVNIFRDPRWGRGQETYGEDPLLTGHLAVAFVRGLQGDDPKYYKVIATPKHFAVHSGPESTRHEANVDVSRHDLEDTYFPAFRMAILDGHADSIMCAYNAVDGVPACGSSMLLQDHLVHDWGFHGYVVSDCDAVQDIFSGHHYAKTRAEAAAQAVKAGTDLDCGRLYSALPEAVKSGLLNEKELDGALRRLLTARFQLGMFDPPDSVPFAKIAPSENDSAAHRQIALRAARESIVLLENDGILPLKKAPKVIAVVGPTAESMSVMQGNYNGKASHPVFTREGLAARFPQAKVLYAKGSDLVDGLLVNLPAGVLFTAADKKVAGLTAEYFRGGEASGTPEATEVDQELSFNPRHNALSAAKVEGPFTVRWSGVIVAPKPGAYRIGLSGLRSPSKEQSAATMAAERRMQIFLDDQELAQMQDAPFQALVNLQDRNPHRLKVVYRSTKSDSTARLQWQTPAEELLQEAMNSVQQADVVVACVGLSPDLEGEEMSIELPGFAGGDRTRLELPQAQQRLLDVLAATGKPLVVVLNNGSALAVGWAKQRANALIEQWYPGEEGGDALAQLLAGDFSPSGKLPMTFYKSVADLPAFDDYSMAHRTYRYYDGAVLYPFGYGLSYRKVEYSGLNGPAALHAGDNATYAVTVRNTSAEAADEVVEAYLRQPQSGLTPRLALAAFTRVHLSGGEARTVPIELPQRVFSQVDANGVRRILPGEYKLYVGAGQPGTQAAGVEKLLKIDGALELPR